MAKPIKMWTTEVPGSALGGYLFSVCLLIVGSAQPVGTMPRVPLMIGAIIVFLAGAQVHILHKIDEHNEAVHHKIDDSVGDVYDTGERAGRRKQALEDAQSPTLAVVRDLAGK